MQIKCEVVQLQVKIIHLSLVSLVRMTICSAWYLISLFKAKPFWGLEIRTAHHPCIDGVIQHGSISMAPVLCTEGEVNCITCILTAVYSCKCGLNSEYILTVRSHDILHLFASGLLILPCLADAFPKMTVQDASDGFLLQCSTNTHPITQQCSIFINSASSTCFPWAPTYLLYCL